MRIMYGSLQGDGRTSKEIRCCKCNKITEIEIEVKRLRGLLDEIDDVVYYNDKKAGQVLPVEKPNLELLRDIMMSYTDEAYQIRGDEGEWIE